MKRLKPFAYFEPGDLPEASRLLVEQGEGARLLAGGTDLLVRMKKGEVEPAAACTAPAIAYAIYDALGVWMTDLPIIPEKVLAALRQKKNERGA